MNLVLPSREMPAAVRLTTIRLGMPHLTPMGLSETWLLRQLGDLHWQMLAEASGQGAGALADRDGNRVYAAFRHVAIESARFGSVEEDGSLDIVSSLARLSRTRLRSHHNLTTGGLAAGSVTMDSVFVRREMDGSNRRVRRVEIDGLEQLPTAPGPLREIRPLPDATPAGHDAVFTFTPCPQEDFNGAGFLYFSAYVGLAERAAWALRPDLACAAMTVARTVAYHGNIDIGDAVTVSLARSQQGDGLWRSVMEMRRLGDGVPLATIAAVKFLRRN